MAYIMYDSNYNGHADIIAIYFYTVVFDRKDCHLMLSATC